MRATIELPEPVFQILQARAEQRSLSIQAVILEAIKKEIGHGPTPAEVQGRVYCRSSGRGVRVHYIR